MSLVNYKDLGLTKSKEVNTFTFNNQEIMVKKYLSVEEIYDLLMTTLSMAEEEGIYNAFKMDIYFHLNLVYLYTNIVFDLEDRADEPSIYDTLVQSGLMSEVLSRIPNTDYENYQLWLEEIANDRIAQQNSTAAVINNFLNDFPDKVENSEELLKNIQNILANPEMKDNLDKLSSVADNTIELKIDKE